MAMSMTLSDAWNNAMIGENFDEIEVKFYGQAYTVRDPEPEVVFKLTPSHDVRESKMFDLWNNAKRPVFNLRTPEEKKQEYFRMYSGVSPFEKPKKRKIYLIGSLRNPEIVRIQHEFQVFLPGVEVFADWMAAGPDADDRWRDYEKANGYTFKEALARPAAKNVFEFDKKHLLEADAVVLIAPAGKSAHLELGWCLGQGKPGYVMLDNPDRWDVMLQFADAVEYDTKSIADHIKERLGWHN